MSITLASLIFCLILFFGASSPSLGGPQGGEVVLGSGSIAVTGNETLITQASDKMAVDWESFNIANGERVEFSQPTTLSVVLNRDFSGNASQIMGELSANGQVFLLNPNGILVGQSGAIDTNGLLLSDMEMTLDDFGDNRFTLTAGNRGGVVNRGSIQADEGGVHLVAAFLDNQGTLNTTAGDIQFAVSDGAVIALGSSGRLGVEVTDPLNQAPAALPALINNSGNIVANGADVHLTAFYLASLEATAVNNEGLVNAIALNDSGGRIFLTDRPVDLPADNEEAGGNLVTELDEEVVASETGETSKTEPTPQLDQLVADCDPRKHTERDCRREDAIKHYLGRLLINGRLPLQ